MATINTSQCYPNVTLTITDAQGNPARVDGVPQWASSDETVLAVFPKEDGMSATINSVAPGTGRCTVTADADLGGGVNTLTGFTEDITVEQSPDTSATTMQLQLGEPAEKPQVNPLGGGGKKGGGRQDRR